MAVTRRTFLLGGTAAITGLWGLQTFGSSKSRGKVTLEFWGGQNAEERGDQIKAWMETHPHRKVEFRAAPAVGTGVQAQRKFAAAVAGGKAPHVVDFDRFQVATYVNWRMFLPLDDHIKREKYDLTQFAPAALEEAMGFDRKLYGLPSSIDNRLLYWNKDAFAEAGLDPERPPATWDELKAYAIKLTRRGARGGLERLGFHTEEGQSSVHLFAWQSGGAFQSVDGKAATLPMAPNQDALQWMVDLMRDQAGWSAAASFRDSWGRGAQHPFLTGHLPMQYQLDRWTGEFIAKYRPDMNFGVAAPPVRSEGSSPLTWSGGYSYVMSRNSKNPDAGWEFIKWLVSEEGWTAAYDGAKQRARDAGGVWLPGMTGQPELDKRMYAKYETERPALDRVPEMAVGLMEHTRFRELSIAAADLWDGVTNAQVEAVSQAKSTQRALEDHNATVQRALEQAWVFIPQM